jgi:putative transcriptional regulator
MDKNSKHKLKAGKSLIADPFLLDPIFQRTVIILTEYSKEGAMGFVLNQPTNILIHEAFQNFPKFDSRVFIGGPVDQDVIYFIHTKGEAIAGSMQITKNLWLGGDFEVVKDLINEKKLYPNEIRFFLGYSGWSENQLEEEIEKESWLIGGLKQSYVFKNFQENLWREALALNNPKLGFYGNYAFTPSFN